MGDPPRALSEWAESWQRSWDRLEEGLVPDRERQISVLLDVVEAVAGTAPTVMDLGVALARSPADCSIGCPGHARSLSTSIRCCSPSRRRRSPTTTACTSCAADLRHRGLGDALPEPHVDAVVTATALHWLPEDAVRRLYRDLAVVIGRGGVVAHSERMPLADLPRLGRALAEIERPGSDDRRARWDAWWDQASREPALQHAVTQRCAVFETTYPTEEFSPTATGTSRR